jgi:hypothetical protein
MIDVKIVPRMLAKADELSEAVLANLKDRNFTGLEVRDRYRNGYLGEFAIWQVLSDAGVRFRYDVSTTGRGDLPEFTCWAPAGPLKVDVKTNAQDGDGDGEFRANLKQLVRHGEQMDGYVGCRLMLARGIVRVWGWVDRETVWNLPVAEPIKGHPCRCCPHSKLTPIEEWVTTLSPRIPS